MRRFRIIGLAVLALLALSALAAAVASGLEGVLGSTTVQVVGGATTLETELANSAVQCSKVTGNGIFLAKSDEHGTATLDFTGCKTNGVGANSLGDAKEVILSKVLFFSLLSRTENVSLRALNRTAEHRTPRSARPRRITFTQRCAHR